MKKLPILLFLGQIITITECAILDEITNTRKNLASAQVKIANSAENLKDTHTGITTDIINVIDSAVTGPLQTSINEIQSTIKTIYDNMGVNENENNFLESLKKMGVDIALQIACTGELLPSLKIIRDEILPAIGNTLTSVKNNFKTAIVPLDFSTDTTGIYATMEEAKNEFKAADEGFAELQDGLLEFASAPPPPQRSSSNKPTTPPVQKPPSQKGQGPQEKMAQVKQTIGGLSQPMTTLNQQMLAQTGGDSDTKGTPIGKINENATTAFQEINAGTRSIKTPDDITNLKQALLTGIDEAAIKKTKQDANAVLDQLKEYLEVIKTLTSVSDIAKANVGDIETIATNVKNIYNQLLTNEKVFYDALNEKLEQATNEQINHNVNAFLQAMTTLNKTMVTVAGGNTTTAGTPIGKLYENAANAYREINAGKRSIKTAADTENLKQALLAGIDQAAIAKTTQDAAAAFDQLNQYLKENTNNNPAVFEATTATVKNLYSQLLATNKAFYETLNEKLEQATIEQTNHDINAFLQTMTTLNKTMITVVGGGATIPGTPIGKLYENAANAYHEISAGTRSIKTPTDIENLKQALLTGIDQAAITKTIQDANAALEQLNQYLKEIPGTPASDGAKNNVAVVEATTATIKNLYSQLLATNKALYDLLDEKLQQATIEQIKHDINTLPQPMTALNQTMITEAGGDANTPGTPIALLIENAAKISQQMPAKKSEKTPADPEKIKNALLTGIDQAKIVKTKQDAQALIDQLNKYLQQLHALTITTDAAQKSIAEIKAAAITINNIFNQLLGTDKAFDDALTEKIEQVNLEQIKHALGNLVQPMTTLNNTMATLAGGDATDPKTPLGRLNKNSITINKAVQTGRMPNKSPEDLEKIKTALFGAINEKGIIKTKQLADSLLTQLNVFLQQASSFTPTSDAGKTLMTDIEKTANTIKTAHDQLLATHKALYDALDEHTQQATSSTPAGTPTSHEKLPETSKKTP